MKKEKLNFLIPKKENNLGQWLIEQGISAGFPSPADDFKEIRISLDKELVKNEEASFYARVSVLLYQYIHGWGFLRLNHKAILFLST